MLHVFAFLNCLDLTHGIESIRQTGTGVDGKKLKGNFKPTEPGTGNRNRDWQRLGVGEPYTDLISARTAYGAPSMNAFYFILLVL